MIDGRRMGIHAALRQKSIEMLPVLRDVGLVPESVPHVPGPRPRTVLVVAVLHEVVDHRTHMIQDLGWIHRLRDLNTDLRIASQPSCGPDVEEPVGPGDEPQVPERRMGLVPVGAGERDLQLPGQFHLSHDIQEVFLGGLGIRVDVEVLAGLHPGEGCCRDIAGIVPSSALGVDTVVESIGHHLRHLVACQIVDLHGLAGGRMDPFGAVSLAGTYHEVQLVIVHAAPAHAESDHGPLAALLGVTAESSGDALELLGTHLACEEPVLRIHEHGDAVPEESYIFHHGSDGHRPIYAWRVRYPFFINPLAVISFRGI